MLNTIEQKLSAIKAINEKIHEVDLAIGRHAMSREINWTLLNDDDKAKIHDIIKVSFARTKEDLLSKASELMK